MKSRDGLGHLEDFGEKFGDVIKALLVILVGVEGKQAAVRCQEEVACEITAGTKCSQTAEPLRSGSSLPARGSQLLFTNKLPQREQAARGESGVVSASGFRTESSRLYWHKQPTRVSSDGGCGAGLCTLP